MCVEGTESEGLEIGRVVFSSCWIYAMVLGRTRTTDACESKADAERRVTVASIPAGAPRGVWPRCPSVSSRSNQSR